MGPQNLSGGRAHASRATSLRVLTSRVNTIGATVTLRVATTDSDRRGWSRMVTAGGDHPQWSPRVMNGG